MAMMALATDGLNRLFSNDVAILRIARDLGLGLVDRAPMLKKALIRHAAAIGRNEPRLLRGLEIYDFVSPWTCLIRNYLNLSISS